MIITAVLLCYFP